MAVKDPNSKKIGGKGNGGNGGNKAPDTGFTPERSDTTVVRGRDTSKSDKGSYTSGQEQVSRFASPKQPKEDNAPAGVVVPDELKGKGTDSESIAGKKSAAEVKTQDIKWIATPDNVNTVTATEHQDTGNKHKTSDGRAEAYHATTEAPKSRFETREEDEVHDANFTVKDKLNREMNVGSGVQGSALEKGLLFSHNSDDENSNGGASANPLDALNGHKDSVNKKDDGGTFVKQNFVKDKAIDAKDVSRVQKKHGTKDELAQAVQQAVENQYSGSDYIQGQDEAKNEMKNIAYISGGTAIAHAGRRANIHAEITQRGIRDVLASEESKARHAEAIKDAEAASGGTFVTSSKNSYGSLTKDIQNNKRIIINYFKKKDLDISGYDIKDLEKAIKLRKLTNKVGKDIELSDKDIVLLKEQLKLLKREKAMKACGTWRDDTKEFLEKTYEDSDAYQGYKQVKTGAKVVKGGVKAGKTVVTAGAGGLVNAASDVAQAANRFSYFKTRVTKKGLPSGADKNAIKKWRADEKLKYRDRKSKIKVSAANKKRSIKSVVDAPITSAAKGMGKAAGKFAEATVGKTKFGQRVSSTAKSVKDRIEAVNKKRLAAQNRIKNNKLTKALGTPFRAVGKAVDALNFLKKVIMIAFLFLLLASVVLILITSAISAIIPNGADKSNFEDRQTLWEDAKNGINEEFQDISKECVTWVGNNYNADRENRGSSTYYTRKFEFAGFTFNGPTNLLSTRDDGDSGGMSAADYSKRLSEAQEEGEAEVPENASATDKKYILNETKKKERKRRGTVTGPSGKETFYNLDLANCVHTLDLHCKGRGNLSDTAHYFVRSDGVECYGDEDPKKGAAYVLVASNNSLRPKGTIVMTSLGPGIVADACAAANSNPRQLDIAVTWQTKGRPDKDKFKTVNSGTIDTWGSDLNSGSMYVDGKTACSSNYLRDILAMATTATGNEDNPDNTEFYTKYCRHLVRNSWNYTKYVAAKTWQSQTYTEPCSEPPVFIPWDDPYLDQSYLDKFAKPGFSLSVADKVYVQCPPPYKGLHLVSATLVIKCNFLDCGLWGDYHYDNKDYKDDGSMAGKGGSPDVPATSIGMFDVETYDYSSTDACGNPVKNDICDDDFLHSLVPPGLFGKGKSSEYEILDKYTDGYETWDGWEENGEIDGVGTGNFIFESGSNTSLVQATYDITDAEYAEMGVTFDGVYNIDNTTDEAAGDSGGKSSLSQAQIDEISKGVATQLTSGDAPERQKAIDKALSLCGKIPYVWGGDWSANTSDAYVISHGLDCSGTVSYVVYKSGAKKCPFSSVQWTGTLKSYAGKYGADPKHLRPGDILVRRSGGSGHAVMYMGSTSKGKFTIFENTSPGTKVHLSYYSSFDDFIARRGDYKYFLNFYGD